MKIVADHDNVIRLGERILLLQMCQRPLGQDMGIGQATPGGRLQAVPSHVTKDTFP